MIAFIVIAAFISTLLGGLFALKLRDKLHLILGFSAGAVIAVAFFDLMPESLVLGGEFYKNNVMLSIVALGFMVYFVLDRLIFLHSHNHDDEKRECGHDHSRPKSGDNDSRSVIGAGSLCLHSFMDGVAIGLSFQVSTSVGVVVAAAVLTHDFSDGINIVGIILRDSGLRSRALSWLIADAAAPVVGIVATLFFTVSKQDLGIIMALFSGFFLYIGASDLIPESYHTHPKFLTTAMTLFGAAVLYAAINFAS